MSETLSQTPLSMKEAEALMWCLGQIVNWPYRKDDGPGDPLHTLLALGYTREAIMETGEEMFSIAYNKLLCEPLTALEKAILKVCVENTTWIGAYRTGKPTMHRPLMINEALQTLRLFAKKLEALGIEIVHIPND